MPVVPAPSKRLQAQAADTSHYENFPVASFLCPAHLRPPIAAIYGFARTADDIADEGDAPADQRWADLEDMHADLMAAQLGQPGSGRWPQVFAPLASMMAQFNLPVDLLSDLLTAFKQDVAKSRDGATYANRAALIGYCRYSANPVGRLVLHLYGVADDASLRMSDDICTALQLINFWQDLGLDIARGRYYLPSDECEAYGVKPDDLAGLQHSPNTILIANNAQYARTLMLKGAPLVKKVPGRAGWELRLVVQGGLRILDKIEAMHFATLTRRPKITLWDVPVMLWRALGM
jgi:hydroxysqualene synthase